MERINVGGTIFQPIHILLLLISILDRGGDNLKVTFKVLLRHFDEGVKDGAFDKESRYNTTSYANRV